MGFRLAGCSVRLPHALGHLLVQCQSKRSCERALIDCEVLKSVGWAYQTRAMLANPNRQAVVGSLRSAHEAPPRGRFCLRDAR